MKLAKQMGWGGGGIGIGGRGGGVGWDGRERGKESFYVAPPNIQ